MATEIRVPVKLEVLQNSISDMQKVLNNLQPNTNGYKALEKIIQSMVSESQKLQAQLSKPFTSESQFKNSNKTIDKLEESAARIQVIMGQLSFSDLKLTPAQQASFDELNKKISEIKANYETLTNQMKQKVVSNADNKALLNNLPSIDLLKANFADIKAAVDKHVADLQTSVEKERKVYEEMRSNAELASRARVLTTSGKGISRETIGKSLFDKYLYDNNGQMGFKLFGQGSGSKAFLEALEQEFKLEPGALKELVGKTFDDINKAFQEMGNNKAFNPFKGLISAYDGVNAQKNRLLKSDQLQQLEAQITEYKRLQSELQNIQNTQVGPADTAAQQQIEQLSGALTKLEGEMYKTIMASAQMSQPVKAVGDSCNYLRSQLEQTNAEFLRQQRVMQTFNSMKMAVVNFMGFNQVLNITRRAVSEAINHIKELDTVMNGIAIVTDMSTGDLWNQIDQYSKMAQAYGVSITGAYEVSQIYYQQGLETADVMTLTNETLKLAKISGLDYATTTDYMTTAIRGFKMEMSEASTVVDVYSNLAAHTAVSQEELAVAMSKTASSMEGVGATFEEASAMIGTMVAVTRESATNIGSAMKSIASRYGELTKDPTKLVDEEGEAMAFNKVDAALQSVGISMRTVDGQFREFTDVIVELGEKWNELDSTQQRYIATQFAGNRQQSRFLALVSNVDLLKSNLDVAMNSEDTGTLQALKALDSIESKIEQVRVAYQQFYTTIGIESAWKGFLDGAKNVIDTLNGLPKVFGKLPVGAIAIVYDIISLVKNALTHGLTSLAELIMSHLHNATTEAENSANKMQAAGANFFDKFIAGMTSRYGALKAAATAGVEEANKAAEQKAREQREAFKLSQMAQWNKNDDQITSNKAEIALLTSYTTTPADADTAIMQAEGLQRLGLTAEEARNRINELKQANVQLGQANQELELSINAETNAEDSNANAKEKNALKTKEGRDAALKYAASQHQLSQTTSAIASGLNMVATMIGTGSREAQIASGSFMMLGGALRGVGAVFEYIKNLGTASATAFPWMAAIMAGISIINGISQMWETDEERIERLSKAAEELSNKAKEAKAEYRTIDTSIKKLDELQEKRYESAEAAEEYQTTVDELADKFPEMIAGFDKAGNIILDTTNAENVLTRAREKSAQASYDAAKAEMDAAKDRLDTAKKSLESSKRDHGGLIFNDSELDNARIQNADALVGQMWEDSDRAGEYWGNSVYLYLKELHDQAQEVRDSSYEGYKFDFDFLLDDWDQIFDASNYSDEKVKSYFDNLDTLTEAQQAVYNLLFEDPSELLRSYNTQIEKLQSDLAKEDYSNINSQFTELTKTLRTISDLGFDTTSQSGALTNLMQEYAEYINLADIYSGYSREVISMWQQSKNANISAWEEIKESNASIALVNAFIEKNITDKYQGDYNKAIAANAERDWRTYQQQMADFYIALGEQGEEYQEQFNLMFSDPDNYSAEDFYNAFSKFDGFDTIYPLIENYYTNGFTSIQNRITERIKKLTTDDNGQKIQGTERYDKIDPTKIKNRTEELYISNLISQAEQLDDRGLDSYADSLIEEGLKLFDAIEGLDASTQKAIYDVISNNGLSTVEGLQAILTSINNNESIENKTALTDPIEEMLKYTISNINLSMQAATSNILETFEDTSKELGKAMSSGFDLTEADALIGKAHSLGLDHWNLDTFIQSGDKLLLTAEATQEYWEALNKSNEDAQKSYEKKISIALQYLAHVTEEAPSRISDGQIKMLEEIGFDWTQYFDKETKAWKGEPNDEESVQAFINALRTAITLSQDNLDDLTKTWEIASAIMKKSWDYSQGNYGRSIKDLKKIAQETSFDRTTKEGVDRKAIHDSLNEAYNNLISDVLSKGIDRIDVGNYEGLINEDADNLKAQLKSSYTEFVRTYLDYTGLSIEEKNDLMLQAMEKDNALKSIDILKDFQYESKNRATTTLSALNEYASRVGVSIDEILSKAVISANATLDEYVVDMTALSALGNKLKIDEEELQAATQDSINSYWDNIVKLIQSGLNGQLSNADWQSLRRFSPDLAENGYTAGLEGLQLTDESFLTLYGTVSKTNKLLAKSLLPDLIKTSGRYKTLGDVLREFEETTDKARKDMLKDIASSMLREPDRYNLMGGDLPTTWQIADNFYGSAYKGNEVIKGMQKGKVSASDFSAFMQSILDNTQNAEDRQWALEQLQNAPDYFFEENGTLMVDTAQMGLTKYQQYYDIMVRAYDVVRKAGAKEQEIYNALYYGSESLQNADIYNQDGTVNSQKLINLVDGKTKQGENIKAALEKIQIGNKSLYEMLKSGDKDTAKMIQLLAETNWDYENLDTQLEEYFSHYGGGTVTIDDVTGKIIFKASDGDEVTTTYKVGDKDLTREEYSKWLAARAKAGIKDTDITEENAANDITYTIGGQKITVSIDGDCKVQYTANYKDTDFVAETEADLLAALRAYEWTENTEESSESTPKTRTVKIGNIKYIIDADGTVTLADKNQSNTTTEDIAKKLEQELQTKPPKVETPVEGEVSNLNLKLAEGATINLITNEEALKLSEVLASVDGDLSRLMLTPKDVFALINETVPKLSGTLSDAEYNHVMTALIKVLQLSWAEGANNEPDLTPLDLKTEVEAPELVVKQKVRLDIETDDDPYIALNRILNGRPANEYAEAVEKYSTVTYNPQTDRFTYTSNGAIEFSKIIPPAGWEYDLSTNTFTTTAEVYVPLEYTEVPEELEEPKVGIEVIDIPPEELDSVVENATENIDKIGLETDLSKVTAQINDYKVPKKEMIIEPRFIGLIHGFTSATGTFNALASGRKQTLMGELGPELYVQNGHYYIAGQTGPEMVSLADDAIVFNHLQTERLLKNGKTYGHGKPVTNEYRAAGMAKAKVASELYNSSGDKLKSTKTNILFSGLIPKTFNAIKTKIETFVKDFTKSTKNLNNAANNLSTAAKKEEEAAETQAEVIQEQVTEKRRNKYGSQQESRGIVHPNGVYKLKDIFAGTETATTGGGGGTRASGTNIYQGTGNTLGREISQVLKTQIASAASGNTEVQKSLKEAKSAVSTFLSDLLSQGIESIDLSKYDKLTKELTNEIQAKINKGDSYRSFIKTYAAAMDKSIHEINATYFEAWQKDLEKGGLAEVQLEAMEGLSFFNNGEIAGSADDWTTILGDATFVGDAEEAGILEWNAALRQFIVRDQKALEEFMNTQLDTIWNFPDAIVDGAQSVTDEINDLISKAMDEGLESKSKTRLQELLRKQGSDAELEFIRGTNGKYALTNASAKALAQETVTATSTSHQITDTSRSTAEEMLSSILQGVEDSHITKEVGDQISDWLQSQGKSLTDLDITETDTGYEISLNTVLTTLKTFGKDYQNKIMKIASGLDIGQLDESEINELIKSIEEVGGQGSETIIANYKDKIVTKLNEALDAITSGFGQDNIMSATAFETMKTNFADLDIQIDPSKFEAVEGGYKASWDTITSVYNAALLKQPEAAARWLKSFSNETLSSNEQRQKATLLKAAGDLQSSSETLDAITERAKTIGDILTSGFGENKIISFADMQAAQDAMKLMDIDSSTINFETNEEGAIVDFEAILSYFKQIVDDAPAYAITMLNSIADDMLTKEQQLVKAEALSAANAKKESAEALDAITVRAKTIGDILTSGFGENNVISFADIQNAQDAMKLMGIDSSEINFEANEEGATTSFESILAYFNQIVKDAPTYAISMLSGIADNMLTKEQQTAKANALAAANAKKENATVLDAITERYKNITTILMDGFGKNNFISESDYNTFQNELENAGLESINLEKTVDGYKTTFDDVVNIFSQLITEQPDAAIQMLNSVNDDLLTNTQIAQKAALLAENEAKQESAEVLDAIVERINSIKDIIVNGISGTLSNSDVNSLKDNLRLAGISTSGLDFKATTQGLQITPEAIEALQANLTEAFNNGTIDELTATKYADALKDATKDFLTGLSDKISKGLQGTLSNADVTSLKEALSFYNLDGLDLQFKKTVDGLKLSSTSAITLYTALQKVDKLQSTVVFKELRASLEESNDKYKTMTSLIINIVDLQEKINQADKYNDAKVRQYKEELALAKEIAAIRATSEDSSFNFLDQDIPGAMNNPLNYVENWSNAWNELRDAATDNKAIDFQHFYNILGEMNNLAQVSGQTLNFMGMTLDGSLEAWDAAVNKSIDALGTDADKNYGVLLSKFGDSLSGGADAFAASADGAIHTMAKAQVEILDALIQVFEVIVAMENFEKADINANDLLDFEEIFSDTSNLENAINYTEAYTSVVKELLSKLDQNSDLYAAFDQIKIGGYTLNQIIEDASDGIKDADISSQTLAALMSALYNTLKAGDFDLSNIAESLKTWMLTNTEGLSGQIDLGQFVLDFDYNVAITKNVNGTYTIPGGQTFNDFNDAVQAAVQEEIDKNESNTNTAEADAEVKVEADTEEALTNTQKLVDNINDMSATIDVNADVSNALDELSKIVDKLDEISDSTVTIQVENNTSDNSSQATGNVAMAAGTRTLMGELGPELYVSGGRYHVAGENGAEFVNLPKDAIVFNHLQTQRLLATGSTGRGRAITSEANAVALAKGGPAAANAQKTLATLKQLRAMWSRLAEASIVDLAGAVNKESSGDKNKVGSWVADVERWYNLLQKIAKLEKEINYQEALRSKIEADRVPNGIEYYQSQVDSLKNLREQAATQKLLADSYDEYFETRRKELNESPLSKFYEFNEAGQVQYKEGGLYQLASLFELDDTGKARYTPKQQYDILKSMGLGEYMLRDSNGLAIERDNENIDQFYYDSVQAAYERMTAEQQEMQDLYNNKEEAKVAYLEAITKADKLLQDIIDNQMDMEQKVLDAIETREQKIIDKMTKERQALADSSAKYFEGLEQALNKEREMYSRQQDQDSLVKLQRRLSILQRSGGSASEIASLQQEITDKQRDAYFEAQEAAIQEAKDASDLQLEKMQEQIDLMTETLEYEKANGLLWGEVATILSGTSESIIEFITTNMPEWQAKSATAQNEELRTLRNSTQQWVAYYNNGEELVQEMMGGVQESVDSLALDQAKRWNEEIQKSSPLQLNYPVLDTQVAEMQALYDNNNSSTQIDKIEYNVNVKEVADAKETERLIQKAMMEGEYPWKNAFKLSPVNNSMSKGRYS